MTDPLVEGLLEKGAQALAESTGQDWGRMTPVARRAFRKRSALVLDAVLPGWREGISREWGWVHPDRPEMVPVSAGANGNTARDLLPRGALLQARLFVRSAWLPVEDGEK